MSDPLGKVLSGAIDLLAREALVGTTMSRPILAKADGSGDTYCVDVRLVGHTEDILKNVPIASDAGIVHYAEPGAAVQLWRIPLTGNFEVVGLSKQKPDFYHRYAVDLGTGEVGPAENSSPSTRRLR